MWRKWWLYVGIAAVVGAVVLYVFFYTHRAVQVPSNIAEQKKVPLYPAPYSDTHITSNAKATDPRFKKLAAFDKKNLLANVASSRQADTSAPETPQSEKGTWLWTPIPELTPAYWNTIIAGAKKNGVSNIYLSIDSYLDIYVMPDGPDKRKKLREFDNTIEKFIATAHKNNMLVDAEAGWRNWAEPGNEYKPFAVVDYVLQFNATHTEKFRALQYDIEPYLLDSYATDKGAVLHNFVALVNETVTRLDGSDVALSIVIPDFYDAASRETPRFVYGWSYGYTLDHLLDVLERRPGSTIIVMAYRKVSKGADGSIDISEDEVRAANGYHTKVIVAQETGDVLYTNTTFYHTSLAYLNTQIKDIQEAFTDDKSYNGIAIHYINALMALK